jgi:hypothetical protein
MYVGYVEKCNKELKNCKRRVCHNGCSFLGMDGSIFWLDDTVF